MSERAPYSRVYWSIYDDEKFVTVYDDDRHLAAWLRLLLAADQAWPASAHIPGNVKKASLAELERVGLITTSGHRFRLVGLDREREKRRASATRDPVATQAGPKRDPVARIDEAETRRDEAKPTAREKPYEKAWRESGRKYPPTAGQQAIIDDYLLTFDKSGPERLARIFLENRKDPIGAALRDRDAFREERKAEYAAQEKEAADRRRGQRAPVELPRNAA